MSRQIVIFDMDGTLIDSSIDITSSVNFVRSHLGLDALSIDSVVKAINSHERNLAKIFYDKERYEEREQRLFEAHYYDECVKNVQLYDGIGALLEQLKEQNVLCSVATNAPAKYAHRMLGHLNIAHHFDHIHGACSYPAKPDPSMLNAILKAYSYDTINDLTPMMIGDNEKDIVAAKNAGIQGCHVTWGFASSGSTTSINHPNELVSILDI